ncbi:MAG: ribonuclease, partial [Deinococcus sp.]|nr:ribonuclease [Deinococcus sp.]
MPKVNKGGAAQNVNSVSADSEQTMKPDPAKAAQGQQGKRQRKATTPAQAAPQSAADAVKPSKKPTRPKPAPAAVAQEQAAEMATPAAEPLLTVAAEAQPTGIAPARAKRGRKVPAETAPAEAVMDAQTEPEAPVSAQPEPQAEAPVEQPKTAAPKRGRKAPVNPAPVEAGEEVAAETTTSPLPEPAPAESVLAEPDAPVPAVKARRGGRKVSVPAAEVAEVETAQAEAITPVEEEVAVEAAPAEAAVAPAKRPRRAKSDAPAVVLTGGTADSNTVETAVLELAEAVSPTPTDDAAPAAVDAEPVLLEVPIKPRKDRKAKAVVADAPAAPALLDVPLTEVLSGVEAVPVETPAGEMQELAVAEPAPAAQPAPPKASRAKGKGRGKQTDAAPAQTEQAVAEQPAQVEPEEAGPAQAQAEASDTPDSDNEDNQNPARDIVIAQLRKLGRPVHVRDLERTFTRQTISRIGDWRSLEALLDTLTESGEVVRTRRHTYGLPEAMSLVRGRFQASAAGFGFVVPDSGGEDYYVAEGNTMEAWNGDIVLVRMEGRGGTGNGGGSYGSSGPRRGQRGDGSPRASVVRIVQRAYKQLVGTLEFHHGHPILKPDDHRARHRILVFPEGIEGLEQGARVVTELYWPEHTGEDEVFGQIKRVLGNEDDPETETEAVIVKFGLRGEFAPEAVEQANAIPAEIPAE